MNFENQRLFKTPSNVKFHSLEFRSIMSAESIFPEDYSLRAIIPLVLILHVLMILWFCSIANVRPILDTPKRMVVTTVKLNPKPAYQPPKPIEDSSSAQQTTMSQPPEPIQEPVQKREEPAPAVEKPKPPQPKVEKTIPEPTPVVFEEPKPQTKPQPKPAAKKTAKKVPEQPKKKPKNASKPVKKEAPPPKVKKPEPKIKKEVTDKPAPKKQTVEKKIEKASPPPEPPKPDPAVEALKAKQRTLLQQAKEKMGRVDTRSDKLLASAPSSFLATATPSRIESLNIDTLFIDTATPMNAKEMAYRDELAHRLKLLLKLPDYGEVKLKLTLERSGKVLKVKILNAQSSGNREYVEKTLPSLKMPAFGNNFAESPEYTFTITMSNE